VTKLAPKHRPEIEELIAHLTAYHACDTATAVLEEARQSEFAKRYASAIERPDGTRHVVFDQAEFFDSPSWWARLSAMHAAHSHDDEGDLKPWHLHLAIGQTIRGVVADALAGRESDDDAEG
jgi:hypothetical protein